ncbi:YjbQ family protein [Thiocapsa sp.]|uniref:YjbQ family protein n=1 Tax=Thiocapsa sp. TaxID=2024551 RepID=UPI0035939172
MDEETALHARDHPTDNPPRPGVGGHHHRGARRRRAQRRPRWPVPGLRTGRHCRDHDPKNWDDSVQEDVIDFLAKQIPKGVWRHDAQDGNGDAHLKAGLVGPSESVPLVDGELGLSRWQNLLLFPTSQARKLCCVEMG